MERADVLVKNRDVASINLNIGVLEVTDTGHSAEILQAVSSISQDDGDGLRRT